MSLDLIEQRLNRLTDKASPKRDAAANDATEKPAGWRFVPRRDEDNLIVEIIATPIE